MDESDDVIVNPLFQLAARAGQALKSKPLILIFIIALLLTLFYLFPTYFSLLIIAVTISITVGIVAQKALSSEFVSKKLKFSDVEVNIIGGLLSGTIGFVVGSYMGNKLRDKITWGYNYRKMQEKKNELFS